jgi:hypothetical protein
VLIMALTYLGEKEEAEKYALFYEEKFPPKKL